MAEKDFTFKAAMTLKDADFEALLVRHLRPSDRSDRIWQILMAPEVLERTHEALDIVHRRTKAVMDAKSAELEVFRAQCDRLGPAGRRLWNEGRPERMASFRETERFLATVEEAQVQVGHRVRRANVRVEDSGQRIRRLLPALRTLVDHVLQHEDEMSDDPSQADEGLWEILDETKVIVEGKVMTLRQAHESGWKNYDA